MLEHLENPAVLVAGNRVSENPSGAGNQQGRPASAGTLRGHTLRPVMTTGEDMVRPSERSEEVGGTETTHRPELHTGANSRASSTVNAPRNMKAVAKLASNGETPSGQSRAELCSNVQQGVETRAEPDRMVARAKHPTETGEEPVLLNGERGTRATNVRSIHEGIVRTFGQPENHKLQTRDVQ